MKLEETMGQAKGLENRRAIAHLINVIYVTFYFLNKSFCECLFGLNVHLPYTPFEMMK